MTNLKLIGVILLRLICALVVISQIMLLIPIYSWLNDLSAITADMYIMATVKITLVLLCAYWFRRLKITYTRIKSSVR
jgi:hypothetical protein